MMGKLGTIILLLGISLWGVKSLYFFAMSNGLMAIFAEVLDTRTLPNGVPLSPITTNGLIPRLDWQIRAPAAFVWSFAGDGSHPGVSLSGLLFVGAWGSAWLLIVLESFRRCNRGRFISYISIWGVFVFNHGHAVVTPLMLATHIFTSQTASSPSIHDITIEVVDLAIVPASFVIGYILPIVLMTLPAPSMVTVVFKQTMMGWYQQWNLFIAVPHAILALVVRKWHHPQLKMTDRETIAKWFKAVYVFAFVLASVPHWIVMVLSSAATLWPSLFEESAQVSLHLRSLLITKSPFSSVKANGLAQGVFWLIQWDYIGGNAAMIVWAAFLWSRASKDTWSSIACIFWKMILYALLAGPMGLAIGLIWERDAEILSYIAKDEATRDK